MDRLQGASDLFSVGLAFHEYIDVPNVVISASSEVIKPFGVRIRVVASNRHASIPWCGLNPIHSQAQFFPLCIVHHTVAISHFANPDCESEIFISFAKAHLAAAGRPAMRPVRRQPPQSRAS
jgi:hypothetical protein